MSRLERYTPEQRMRVPFKDSIKVVPEVPVVVQEQPQEERQIFPYETGQPVPSTDSMPHNRRNHVNNIARLDNQFYHGTFYRNGVGQRPKK